MICCKIASVSTSFRNYYHSYKNLYHMQNSLRNTLVHSFAANMFMLKLQIIGKLYLDYRIRRYLFHQRSTFSQIREELDKDDFYFPKFYNFLPKEQSEGFKMNTALYLKKKNKKWEDLVHSKFEDIIFYIKFFVKKSQRPRFSQINRRTWQH